MRPFPPSWLPPMAIRSLKLIEGLDPGVHPSLHLENQQFFSEYRPYVPGDSARMVDWKVYGRTDKLYVRKFLPRTAANVWIALDGSASMGVPFPEKWEAAVELALTLSGLFLRQGDTVQMLVLQERVHAKSLRRMEEWGRLVHWLEAHPPQGKTEHRRWEGLLLQAIKRRGFLFFLSDFLTEEWSLFRLKFQHDLTFFQVLHEDEKRAREQTLLKDVESGREVFVSSRHAFASSLSDFLQRFEAACQAERVPLFRHFAPAPLKPLLLSFLERR